MIVIQVEPKKQLQNQKIVIFIMMLVFDCVANETIQTQALQESSSVAIENMSVEQLRARVKTLEAELIGYASLKEENKRLRIQLRKMRMHCISF